MIQPMGSSGGRETPGGKMKTCDSWATNVIHIKETTEPLSKGQAGRDVVLKMLRLRWTQVIRGEVLNGLETWS